MENPSTRDQIITAADQLFYQHGFEQTSFADIAEQVSISRGNFYYHFKTKDAILAAVIDFRLGRTRAMLAGWEQQGHSPRERIRLFINILIRNQAKIEKWGCPVGSLCSELARIEHQSREEANKLFTLFRDWLGDQFIALGHPDQADEYAMHILARSQGVATMTQAFQDDAFVNTEVAQMCDWLNTLQHPDSQQ